MSQTIHKVWTGCAASNFLSGRLGLSPEAIVIHRSGEPLARIDLQCQQPDLHRSCHYAIGANGEVHQYVDEKDTAFHAGMIVSPTWVLLKSGKNPNLYTIAIEFEGGGPSAPSDVQYGAAALLISEIARRWNISIDAEHIALHSEIRAGVGCPDVSFDRSKLLHLITANARDSSPDSDVLSEVNLIRSTNIRESPNRTARIVRVAYPQIPESVAGFEDQGERIKGNSCWYRTADGNYLWAGATDRPNPIRFVRALRTPIAPRAAKPLAGFPKSGIQSIDDLLSSPGAKPIAADAVPAAIGAIQDLLCGHGFFLPSVASPRYGEWTQNTASAIQSFQKANALDVVGSVNQPTLEKMLTKPASDPRASEVYLALVLGLAPEGMHKVLSLVAQMEGVGKFAAINENKDRAGLSFGLIQWSQKPGRLAEILAAMSSADRNLFVATFGAGDANLADGLIAHCKQPGGGVDPKTGETVNRAFDLIAEPWVSRFIESARVLEFQRVQAQIALAAFGESYSHISRYAPELVSERSVAFMLDVANQFGNAGAQRLYNSARKAGMKESDLLSAIADRSVTAVSDVFKSGVRARRENFLETALFSDEPFVLGDGILAREHGSEQTA